VLYAFGFGRVGVVVGDLYFVNPWPEPGEEGPERGVRLEVRLFERGVVEGTIYAARPIAVDRPIWRADLLESVAGEPGSLDRAHHHPAFRGWEPGRRQYVAAMSAAPLEFVAGRLADLEGMLAGAGIPIGEVDPGDPDALRRGAPEIVDAVRRLLDGVKAGELGRAPDDAEQAAGVRVGWL